MGFLYLNVANAWPLFDLHQIAIGADGALRLTAGSTRGVALAGPFETELPETQWFRLRAIAELAPESAHLQLFTFTTESGPPPFFPGAAEPFANPGWIRSPRDLADVLIFNPPARQLWVGLILRGDGASTPVLNQMRVDYERETYLTHLPAIYANHAAGRDFTERLLALCATAIGSAEAEIDDLPLLFDPGAAPFPDWLDWLNGWLAFTRSERWSEADARRYLAEAFDLYGWRGTIEGLKRYLKIYAGVTAHITEPGRLASLWSLGEVSTLGFTTMLAPSPLQGAVVGSSAIVDQARLASDDDDGAFLFEDVAHRFCVEVYCGELNYPGALETVRAVLDREKPAHTVYELCAIDANLRIGRQARVGIDTIVGRGQPRMRLGMRLGGRSLAKESKPCPEEA